MAKENTRIQENKHLNTQSASDTQADPASTVEVLYQKMGDRWFAFSLIDDEVFVGSITQAEIDHDKSKASTTATASTRRKSRAGSA